MSQIVIYISVVFNFVLKGVAAKATHQHLQTVTFHRMLHIAGCFTVIQLARNENYVITFCNPFSLEILRLTATIYQETFTAKERGEMRDKIKSNALKAGKRDTFELYTRTHQGVFFVRVFVQSQHVRKNLKHEIFVDEQLFVISAQIHNKISSRVYKNIHVL